MLNDFFAECAICNVSWRQRRLYAGLRYLYCGRCFFSMLAGVVMILIAMLAAMCAGCGNVTPWPQTTGEQRGSVDAGTEFQGTRVDSGTVDGSTGSPNDSGRTDRSTNSTDGKLDTANGPDTGFQCSPGEVYPCDTGLCQCP